jgi:hypothetical protein
VPAVVFAFFQQQYAGFRGYKARFSIFLGSAGRLAQGLGCGKSQLLSFLPPASFTVRGNCSGQNRYPYGLSYG